MPRARPREWFWIHFSGEWSGLNFPGSAVRRRCRWDAITRARARAHTHTLSLSHTHTHRHTHCLSIHTQVRNGFLQASMMHTHTHTHNHARTHAHTHTNTHERTRAHAHTQTHTHTGAKRLSAGIDDGAGGQEFYGPVIGFVRGVSTIINHDGM